MKQVHTQLIIRLIIVIFGMVLEGCAHQPLPKVEPAPPKVVSQVEIKTLHPPSEEILTCLAARRGLPAEQLDAEFSREKESFIAESSQDKRARLICLSLARLERPDSLEYAQELMNDMLLTETSQSPDLKGLLALLHDFDRLQQKRLAEIKKAQRQVNELKKKLEDLKSIDIIMKERKDGT